MGKITVTRLYHIDIPVNDIRRAERFYVDVLRNESQKEGSREKGESNRPFFELPSYWPENLQLETAKGMWKWFCSSVQNRSSVAWKEDSFCHTAFSTSKEDFDLALEKMKEWGVRLHLGPIRYRGGRTLYFFDSEGNYLQIGERGWEPF